MDPLTILPPEIALEIIAYLPLGSLPALRRTSRGWNELVQGNEEAVFKGLAEAREGRCGRPDGRHDWKRVCQCAVQHKLMREWRVATVEHLQWDPGSVPGFTPWRIKVDERRGWVFATTEDEEDGGEFLQGLLVMDLATKSIVQRLPEIKPYAHIEYDAGYLIATGRGDIMDVYRTPEVSESQSVDSSTPIASDAPTREPPLSPVGTLTSPGFRALRMMGTTLATASETRIEVFNVPTLQLIQRIEIPPRQIAMIMYIELDDEYVFICGLGYAAPLPLPTIPAMDIPHPEPLLYVYRRNPPSSGDAYFVIPLSSDSTYPLITSQTPAPDPTDALLDDPRFRIEVQDARPVTVAEVAPFELTSRVNGRDVVAPFRPDVPVACHYGSKNLVVLCRNGSILIIQDYKTTFRLPPDQQTRKIFALSLPSNGPEYWNLAVQGDLAYVTSYQDRLFEPWSILIVIDLATLKAISSDNAFLGRRAAERITGQIDIRSWDIPLPNEISSTHSLQATSEGVYMPVKIVPMRRRPRDEDVLASGWAPADYRE